MTATSQLLSKDASAVAFREAAAISNQAYVATAVLLLEWVYIYIYTLQVYIYIHCNVNRPWPKWSALEDIILTRKLVIGSISHGCGPQFNPWGKHINSPSGGRINVVQMVGVAGRVVAFGQVSGLLDGL